jgi:hypothetical protein
MSMVTSAVLVISGGPSAELQAALDMAHPGAMDVPFGPEVDVDNHASGHCTGLRLRLAGFDCISSHELIAHLRSMPWGHVMAVLVYEDESHDPDFMKGPRLRPVMINPAVDLDSAWSAPWRASKR